MESGLRSRCSWSEASEAWGRGERRLIMQFQDCHYPRPPSSLRRFYLFCFCVSLAVSPLVLAWSSPCRPVVAGRRDEFQKRQLHKCLLLRFLPLSAEREGDGYPQVSGISLTKGKLSSDCCPRHTINRTHVTQSSGFVVRLGSLDDDSVIAGEIWVCLVSKLIFERARHELLSVDRSNKFSF